MSERSLIQIGEVEPIFDTSPPPDSWVWDEANRDVKLWWNPTTKELKRFNSVSGHYDLDVEFKHPDGLTGSRVISDKRLTFTDGILTGFETV